MNTVPRRPTYSTCNGEPSLISTMSPMLNGFTVCVIPCRAHTFDVSLGLSFMDRGFRSVVGSNRLPPSSDFVLTKIM